MPNIPEIRNLVSNSGVPYLVALEICEQVIAIKFMYTVKRTAEFDDWLLGGGDKSTQQADIAAAIALSKLIEE